MIVGSLWAIYLQCEWDISIIVDTLLFSKKDFVCGLVIRGWGLKLVKYKTNINMGYGYHIKGLWTVKKCGKLHEFP